MGQTKSRHARESVATVIATSFYLANREVTNSINQVADIYHLPVTGRPLKKVAGVSIKHEAPLSDEQEESEIWSKQEASAEALEDDVATLISGNFAWSGDIQRHTFRWVGEIRESAVGGRGGHENSAAWEVDHPFLSGDRNLNVKVADAGSSERVV